MLLLLIPALWSSSEYNSTTLQWKKLQLSINHEHSLYNIQTSYFYSIPTSIFIISSRDLMFLLLWLVFSCTSPIFSQIRHYHHRYDCIQKDILVNSIAIFFLLILLSLSSLARSENVVVFSDLVLVIVIVVGIVLMLMLIKQGFHVYLKY